MATVIGQPMRGATSGPTGAIPDLRIPNKAQLTLQSLPAACQVRHKLKTHASATGNRIHCSESSSRRRQLQNGENTAVSKMCFFICTFHCGSTFASIYTRLPGKQSTAGLWFYP